MTVFDGRTGAELGAVAVGNVPVALGVSGDQAWVANGSVPGPAEPMGAGTVQEVTLGPGSHLSTVRTLAIAGVVSITVSGGSPWLVRSLTPTGTPLQVMRLTPSGPHVVDQLNLSVANQALSLGPEATSCGGQVSVTGTSPNGGSTTVTSYAATGRPTGRRTLAAAGPASLVCLTTPSGPPAATRPGHLVVQVSNPHGGGAWCLPPSPTCRPGPFGLPGLSSTVGWHGELVGLNLNPAGGVPTVDGYDPQVGGLVFRGPVPAVGDLRLIADSTGLFLLDNNDLYAVLQ